MLKFFDRSKSLGFSMNGYQDTERVIGPLLSGEFSLFTCSTCTRRCCFLFEIDSKGPPGMVLAYQSLFPPTYLSAAFVSLKCSTVPVFPKNVARFRLAPIFLSAHPVWRGISVGLCGCVLLAVSCRASVNNGLKT